MVERPTDETFEFGDEIHATDCSEPCDKVVEG
jgi:hypothetical protein